LNDINKFKLSFRNAFFGIKTAMRTQKNLRVHIFIGCLVVIISILVKVSLYEFLILFLTILIVLVTEMFNTAIEFTIDLVSPEFNPIAKKVKDISAAAVLIAAIFAIWIGIVVLGPKVFGFAKKLI